MRADRLAAELGLTGGLWVKDDSANPTHSFKDRVVSLAATAAKGLGYTQDRRRLDRQPGQLGGRARRPRRHPVRSSSSRRDLEPGKVVQSAVYGQTLVAVDGSYDDVNRLTSELAETDEFEDTAFVNQNVRPYYAEGSKTMGYEIAEQLGWRIPAQVVIPMASGSLLTKVDKAFRELAAAGIVEATEWTIFGAQSAGCDPIATAFDNGWDVVKPVKPTGIAKSLNIGNPADGPYALDAIRRTGGAVGRVGDDEIVQGIRDLARTTGVFAETAGGVTVAVLRQLVEDGRLDPAKETVVLNTGEGLKTLDPLEPVVGPDPPGGAVAEVGPGGRPHRLRRRASASRIRRQQRSPDPVFVLRGWRCNQAFLLYRLARFEFHVRVRRAEERDLGPPIERGRPHARTWEHTWHRAP